MKNKERSQDQDVVRSRGVATTVLMVATFMDLMDSTITNVALPTIGKNLGATPEQRYRRQVTCLSRAVCFKAGSPGL